MGDQNHDNNSNKSTPDLDLEDGLSAEEMINKGSGLTYKYVFKLLNILT